MKPASYRSRTWIGVALVGVVVVVAVLMAGSARGPAAGAAEPSVRLLGPGDVAVVEVGSVATGIPIGGSLDPRRVVEVRAQLPGTLDRVLVERGEAVRRGQLLALYDGGTLQSGLASAEAALVAARSAAQAAAREEEAAEALYEAGAISERDLRRARSAAAAARAEARVGEARLAEAREAAGRTRVASPIAGTVSRRGVSSGEAVSPGHPLFTLVNTDTLELVARVPAHRIGALGPGRPVTFSLDAYPGRGFRGFIARVDPVADPATRQVAVYIHLPNETGELVGGLYATGRILGEEAEAAPVVPAEAIRGGEGDPYVWAVEGGVLVRHEVVLGPRDAASGRTVIRAGVEVGTTVVVGPEQGLRSGTRVRVHTLVSGGEEVDR